MKNTYIIIILFALFTNFIHGQEEGTPDIKFDKTSHNFGNISEGKNVSFSFNFTNTGNAPLKLTNVKAGCGCTSTASTKEEIPPGEQGFVTATFRPRGYANKNFHKSVTVTTNIINNGQPKRYNLFIKGHVLGKNANIEQDTTIKLSEYSHNFGNYKQGKKLKWSFSITNVGKDTLKIHDMVKSSNQIEIIRDQKHIAPGKIQNVKVIFNTKGSKNTRFSETIKIITNIPVNKTRMISIAGIKIKGEMITPKSTPK